MMFTSPLSFLVEAMEECYLSLIIVFFVVRVNSEVC